MGLFSRKVDRAAISPMPEVTAAVGSGFVNNGGFSGQNAGLQMVGQYYSYFEGPARNQAMSVPVIARSRDLHASVAAQVRLEMYNEVWDETTGEMVAKPIAPRSWLRQPDPALPYSTLMAWTIDDLFFFGRAFWLITSRTADGFPASFTRLPAAMVTTRDQPGPVFFAPSNQVYFQGGQIDENDLVQFISPIQGIIYQSVQAVQTAIRLEAARFRNANSSMPSGVLRQVGGEPLSATELADLSAAFNAARENNQTAALNEFLEYTETAATPDKMLLIDAADYQARDLTRLTNIPPYLAGISIGSYSYTTSQSAREDLYVFGTRAYLECIGQTLSMNNVLPKGTMCRFDIDDYLSSMIAEMDGDNETETSDAPGASSSEPRSTVTDIPKETSQEQML